MSVVAMVHGQKRPPPLLTRNRAAVFNQAALKDRDVMFVRRCESATGPASTVFQRMSVLQLHGEMRMGGYILAVSTRPVRGAEREYHEWYQDFHLDEVLEIPGFISAERLEVLSSEDSALDAGTGTYFALFRVESDDIAVTVNTFREAQKVMAVPSCLDPESVSVQWWRSVGKRSPSANDTQDSAH